MNKPLNPVTFEGDELIMVMVSVRSYKYHLMQHQSWLQTIEGSVLPGAEIANKEVQIDMDKFSALAMKINNIGFKVQSE